MTDLAVDLYGHRVGELRESRGTFDFVADPAAIERFGVGSPIMSFAVPLQANPRRSEAATRRNFFDEVLPEGRARGRLAGNAQLAPDYTIGMLERYGRDVAGALKISNSVEPAEPRSPRAEPISRARVRELLAEVDRYPLSNDSIRRMSSLAGVQDKIVLARIDDDWAEPYDGYASTHIIKPVVGKYPSLIFDEEYGARLARHLGLASHATQIEQFDGVSALVIERYDRGAHTPDGRVHQEDFNQILGMSGDGKYQDHGHPGLRAIARVLRDQIGMSAVERLLRQTTMSLAVGNLDMHAKNLSVLHWLDGSVEFAPAYDVVPQLHLDLRSAFAFEVNGQAVYSSIGFRDIVAEAESWGVGNADETVEHVLHQVRSFAQSEQPVPGAYVGLAEDIVRLSSTLLSSRDKSVPSAEPSPPDRTIPSSPGGWGGPVQR